MGRPDAPIQPDIQLMGLGIQVKLSDGMHPQRQTNSHLQPDIHLMGLGIQVTLPEGEHPRGRPDAPI